MSAFVLESVHIDVLVTSLKQYGLVETGTPSAVIGQMLWEENYRSVNFRYGEDTATPVYDPFHVSEPLHPVAVLKAIECYQYQSCEHPGWSTSEARAYMQLLMTAILDAAPELAAPVDSRFRDNATDCAYQHLPFYDDMPWGVTMLHQVTDRYWVARSQDR